MTITASQFRTNFPAFANTAQYPAPVIEFYLGLAYSLLNASRWNSSLDYGAQLFVAHNLFLERKAQVEAKKGAPPGTAAGPVSSKSAGPVSIAWDTGSAAEPNAGHWNNSTYGQRYIRIARLMGMGGAQLGIGCAPPLTGTAWAGPPPWPGWFSS